MNYIETNLKKMVIRVIGSPNSTRNIPKMEIPKNRIIQSWKRMKFKDINYDAN